MQPFLTLTSHAPVGGRHSAGVKPLGFVRSSLHLSRPRTLVAVLAAVRTAGSPCSGSPCPGYTCLPQQRHLRLRMGLLIEEVAVAGSTGHPCQFAGEGDPCRAHGGDGLRSFARVRKSEI